MNYMKVLAVSGLVALVLVSLLLFYILGAERFADYSNYVRIAEGDGYAYSEHDYVFEWLSRFFLSLSGFSSSERVALLIFANQVVCVVFFVWAAIRNRAEAVFGVLLIFCLFGFLFMTTTLRAAPAYLLISAFYIRGGRFDALGVGLLIFALAWHDSAALVILICMAAYFASLFVGGKLKGLVGPVLVVFVFLSVAVVFFSGFFRSYAVVSLPVDLGVRAAYFDGEGDQSYLKGLFVVFTLMLCLSFVVDKRVSSRARLYVTLLSVAVSFLYVISAVAAVRLALYIYVVILPLRGIFIFEFEKVRELRFYLFLCLPFIYTVSAAGVLFS